MGGEVVQAQYEQLDAIARRFGSRAQSSAELQRRVLRAAQALRNGGWQGRGSAAFFAEMDGKVNPVLTRLVAALNEAQRSTLEIKAIIQQAEEEASRPFRDGRFAAGLPTDGAGVEADDVNRAGGGKKLGHGLRLTDFYKVTNGVPFLGGEGDVKTVTVKLPRWLGGKELTITTGVIHPNDISQAQLGDCFLASSLAVVANQNPTLIRNAIRDNGDGTYTVTFYERQSGFLGMSHSYKPVQIKVTPEFPNGEIYLKEQKIWVKATPHLTGADAINGKQELWPRLIEKAYGQWKANGEATRGYAVLNQGGWGHDGLCRNSLYLTRWRTNHCGGRPDTDWRWQSA